MNRDDVLDLFDGIRSKYIVEAIESQKAVPVTKSPTKKVFLIAAVIAMTALLVGCGIVYVLKMQDLKLGDRQVPQERWDKKQGTMVYETVSRQVLTFSGLKGAPNYEAAREWYEFESTYDPDRKIYQERIDAGTLDWGSAEYALYQCYTQEMRDKVDEIIAKYGLKLRGKRVKAANTKALYAYLNTDGVLLSNIKASTYDVNASFYDGGWFHTDMHMKLTDSPDWPYLFLCSLYYNPKDCFDATVCELNDTSDWHEWNYTTKSGDNLLIIRSPSVWYSWVFCDREDATITLRIETITEVYSDDGVTQRSMTDDQLKAVLDTIDFSICPQPGDPALLEVPSVSKYPAQTSNGYTVEVKEVITDGHISKILLGLTAPENVNLEQYNDRHANGGLSFESFSYTPKEPIHSSGGRISWLNSPVDGDGKVNTVDFTVELYEHTENGIAYKNGSVWYLYLDGLEVEKRDLELHQSEIIWEQDCTWTFEITMDNGDWTEIEFISEPITTNVCYGWDADGKDVFRDETITSIKLRAFGADYVSSSAQGQLDFANYRKEQFPTVVLKDGRKIELRGDLTINNPEADGRRIPLDEVDHLLLIDGTKLYPQE